MQNDMSVFEAYNAVINKKPIVENKVKEVEELDEGIDNSLVKYILDLDFNKNPMLDPADKKNLIRAAGAIQVHIKEIEKEIIDMEPALSSALMPGFEKLVQSIIKKTI